MEKKVVEAVAAGEKHSCLLSNDGTVACWGTNEWLQTGGAEKSYAVEYAAANKPALVGRAIAIASGDHHTCAILDGGEVQCWGTNGSGQLNPDLDPKKTPQSATAPPVKLSSPAIALALGSAHTCALSKDERVRCWGGRAARAGIARLDVDLGDGVRVKAIAARRNVTCAIAVDDTLRCFGSSTECGGGSLVTSPHCDDKHGVSGARLHPIALGAGRRATAVSVGRTGPVVLLDDQTVKVSSTGQMLEAVLRGDGDRSPPFGDAWEATTLQGDKPKAIASGEKMICGLAADGSVSCIDDMGKPEKVAFDKPARRMVLGAHHGCAVLEDGTARCFGQNTSASLGAKVAPARVGPTLTAK